MKLCIQHEPYYNGSYSQCIDLIFFFEKLCYLSINHFGKGCASRELPKAVIIQQAVRYYFQTLIYMGHMIGTI